MADLPIICVCSECNTEFNDESEADKCCKETFECPECHNEYDTQSEADECCKVDKQFTDELKRTIFSALLCVYKRKGVSYESSDKKNGRIHVQ